MLNAGAASARTQDLFLQSMPAEPSLQIKIEAEQELRRFKEHMKQIQAQLEQAVTETLQKIKAAGEAHPVHVVVNEVPVEVTKVVRDEVEKLVETVKYVDRHVEVCSEFAVFGSANARASGTAHAIAIPCNSNLRLIFYSRPGVAELV